MKKLILGISLLLISLTLVACKDKEVVPPVLYDNCNYYYNSTLKEYTDVIECKNVWTTYLHTVVKLTIYHGNDSETKSKEKFEEESKVLSTDVFDEVERIISFYNDISDKYKLYDGVTNVKTINDNPNDTHVISEELFDLIEFSIQHQNDVDNIFNIALGPVIKVWHNYRENCNLNDICELPSITELEEQDVYTNSDNIILDRENLTITMNEFMSLDLGGVSKGYISGVIIDYLDSLDLRGYLLNSGESNISIGGIHPVRDSGDYIIAVTDPSYVLPYYATVYLGDGEQLVTSGDYQQYFEVDDEIYHHIISGDTLFPERYSRSVSIIHTDPGLADLYSTAIFVMTIPEGIEFVNSIDGLEAIWYGMDGTIVFSENFETEYLHKTFE